MKKFIACFIASQILITFSTGIPAAFAKTWKCEEIFGFSPLHEKIIFYDSDAGLCVGNLAHKYGTNEKNYALEKIFASAPIGSSFVILAGFVREIDGKNFLAPNAFLLQKQQNGIMQGWHYFTPNNGTKKQITKFLQNVTIAEINYSFKERLVMLVAAHATSVLESASAAELLTTLQPYFEYISRTTSVECEDGEKTV